MVDVVVKGILYLSIILNTTARDSTPTRRRITWGIIMIKTNILTPGIEL